MKFKLEFFTAKLSKIKLFWIAERDCNKDEMKNRAIFIEFRMCYFQWGKYILNMIVGSDSEKTGSEKDRPEIIIESEELMVEIDDVVLLFEDFDDIVSYVGFPIFRSYR